MFLLALGKRLVEFQLIPVLSIQSRFDSSRFDTSLFSRIVNSFTYLAFKERRIFTQNVFLVQAQTLLEVIEILVQFNCLSAYLNDLYRNDRYVVELRRLKWGRGRER